MRAEYNPLLLKHYTSMHFNVRLKETDSRSFESEKRGLKPRRKRHSHCAHTCDLGASS